MSELVRFCLFAAVAIALPALLAGVGGASLPFSIVAGLSGLCAFGLGFLFGGAA